MADDSTKELAVRIGRLEKLVGSIAERGEPIDISADDIKAYRKVRDVVAADWGEFCGINDCFRCIIRCLRCTVRCYTCLRCDVECNCGPCNWGYGSVAGGLDRFSRLGGG